MYCVYLTSLVQFAQTLAHVKCGGSFKTAIKRCFPHPRGRNCDFTPSFDAVSLCLGYFTTLSIQYFVWRAWSDSQVWHQGHERYTLRRSGSKRQRNRPGPKWFMLSYFELVTAQLWEVLRIKILSQKNCRRPSLSQETTSGDALLWLFDFSVFSSSLAWLLNWLFLDRKNC